MANLASILKDILLFEDSITIPGFGTFETTYQSAQLDEKTGVIHPPTKSVKFNSAKTADPDGKLAKAAGKVGITEKEIAPLLEEFVGAANTKLKEKSPFVIDGVGTLSADENGNITLKPVSSKLSIDNYGLDTEEVEPVAQADRIVSTTVSAPVVTTTTSTSRGKTVSAPDTKTTTKVSTTKVTTTTTTTKQEEKKKNGLLKALLIILPIVALLAVLFVMFKDQILGTGSNTPAPSEQLMPETDPAADDTPVVDITQNDTQAEDPEAILAGVGFADVSPQDLGSKYKKYYLVGGSFKDQQKAAQEKTRLGASDILHVDGTDLYRVVFIGSDSAQEIVDAYRATVSRGISSKNIWLLKNSKSN